MIINHKSFEHSCIGTEHEYTETKWYIVCEEQDFINDPSMFFKFQYAEIRQKKFGDECYIYFKGCRTNTFDHKTKDKRKQRFISMFENFIIGNDIFVQSPYIKP